MKAQELRIGNLIQDDSEKPYKVSAYQLYTYIVNNHKWYAQANPIPLTEEWLEKFGFKVVKGESSTIDLPDGFLEIETEFSYGINSTEKAHSCGHWYSGELHYVHQLQNLYFALTGEELTPKK